MANTIKTTILIVHGGWHVPDSYNKLTRALRDAGFEVHIPRLPSLNGARPPNADLTTDTDLIRSYATSLVEAGRAVAVLMHSYGGHVGTNAIYGLSKNARAAKGLSGEGGVSHLIYMAASALPEGKSPTDKVAEFGQMDLMPQAFDFDEDGTCVPNYPKEGVVGEPYASQLDPEELDTYIGSLLRWNGKGMYQPLQNTPAWRDEAKVFYIYTLGDLTIPIDLPEEHELLGDKRRRYGLLQRLWSLFEESNSLALGTAKGIIIRKLDEDEDLCPQLRLDSDIGNRGGLQTQSPETVRAYIVCIAANDLPEFEPCGLIKYVLDNGTVPETVSEVTLARSIDGAEERYIGVLPEQSPLQGNENEAPNASTIASIGSIGYVRSKLA
ncbi:hypothetical protein F5Y13DRAFT_202801 [Hypoxylon sp. FL1857]|nr:hypothetical protein F5Y13DRAFT_202801 [Hypoxylon sp. FL1857]